MRFSVHALLFSSPQLQRRRRRSGPYRARFAIRRKRWFPASPITIRHTATGVERHLTSGSDGTFSAPALAAGEYTVTAELTRIPYAAARGHCRHRPGADG